MLLLLIWLLLISFEEFICIVEDALLHDLLPLTLAFEINDVLGNVQQIVDHRLVEEIMEEWR
jgi:hypothetical protein